MVVRVHVGVAHLYQRFIVVVGNLVDCNGDRLVGQGEAERHKKREDLWAQKVDGCEGHDVIDSVCIPAVVDKGRLHRLEDRGVVRLTFLAELQHPGGDIEAKQPGELTSVLLVFVLVGGAEDLTKYARSAAEVEYDAAKIMGGHNIFQAWYDGAARAIIENMIVPGRNGIVDIGHLVGSLAQSPALEQLVGNENIDDGVVAARQAMDNRKVLEGALGHESSRLGVDLNGVDGPVGTDPDVNITAHVATPAPARPQPVDSDTLDALVERGVLCLVQKLDGGTLVEFEVECEEVVSHGRRFGLVHERRQRQASLAHLQHRTRHVNTWNELLHHDIVAVASLAGTGIGKRLLLRLALVAQPLGPANTRGAKMVADSGQGAV